MKGAKIPTDRVIVIVRVGGEEVRLTNLRKTLWPALGITKGGLLQFYLDVAPYLLPHIKARAMVMRRYGWPAVTPRILEVYGEAIDERRGRA